MPSMAIIDLIVKILGMKPIDGAWILLVALSCCLSALAQSPANDSATSAPSQQSAPAAQDAKPTDGNGNGDEPLTTIKIQPNEVNVVFTVTDKHGRRITDLKQHDFNVID